MLRFFAQKVAVETVQTLAVVGLGLGFNYVGHRVATMISPKKETPVLPEVGLSEVISTKNASQKI